MEKHTDPIDVNTMPVHLFVKSAKQAKKPNKRVEPLPAVDAYSYRRALKMKYAMAS
ncbi:hypothetical protein GCM10023093_28750 [Nemorincola caseinilytica]|uniref:Transposase n=1 Tax=Nemorincola caseinilytica TaxID=2054315 RepID=A0ABP8NPV8_9BACT